MQATPAEVGIDLANWNWQVVRPFSETRCGRRLSRSTCWRYLHRLGFVYKRPKKRLLKADEVKRAAFIARYAALRVEASARGAKIFFVAEAHCRAEADLHGQWVLKGQPALVDSTCPRWGEQASDSSAVCLGTGEVEYMELEGTSSSATSAAFLKQRRANHPEPLIMIWDNGPAHGGAAVRTFLDTPDLDLYVLRLPAYRPDFNANEAIWAWVREDVTANTCLGTKAAVQEQVARSFDGLTSRTEEVTTRCRSALGQLVATPAADTAAQDALAPDHVGLTCASV